MSLAARLVLALVLLGLAAAGGWRQGVKSTLADWRAADLAAAQASKDARDEDQRRANSAAVRYETTRAATAAHQHEVRYVIRNALQAQACTQPQPLADVVVPAAVLAGLRDAAGAGAAADRPATTGTGFTMPDGPGDSGR